MGSAHWLQIRAGSSLVLLFCGHTAQAAITIFVLGLGLVCIIDRICSLLRRWSSQIGLASLVQLSWTIDEREAKKTVLAWTIELEL